MLFPSHCTADSRSEIFHEYTIFLQPFSIGRASNWTYTRLRIARILNWAEGEVLLARLSRFKFEAFPLIDSQHIAWNNSFIFFSFVLLFVLCFVWKLTSEWSDHSNIYISKKSLQKNVLHSIFNTQNLLIEGGNWIVWRWQGKKILFEKA